MKNRMIQALTLPRLAALLVVGFYFAALLYAPSPALAQVAPSLGTAQSFAVLGGSTVTNTGATVITGDLGVSPGTAVTGFPPGTVVGGTIHAADAVALQAKSDTTTAYNNLAGQACEVNLTGQNLGGKTLVSAVYCFTSSAQLTGTLTLDAQGDANAVFIFQIGSTLTTASNSSVLFINGAQPCNVFWQVGSSATIGTGTTFIGNILALTSISLTTNATVSGSALARNGAVTLDSNRVTVSACAVPPGIPIPPTLGKAFSPATINAGDISTLTITLSNSNATAASLTVPFTDTMPSGVTVASTPTTTCSGTITSNTSSVTLTGGSIPANGSCTVTVPVTAASGGNYINSLVVGALQTSNGSNTVPAVATLTVNTPAGVVPPTLGKAFSPATINAGGVSTLTITLSNTNGTASTLTAPLIDTLPSGLVIAPSPAAGNTCGGTVTAAAGGSTVTLSTGSSIPANGSCTVTVDLTVASGGSYFNSLAAGALQTDHGNNAAPAVASLTVNTPAGVTPTLGKAFSPATVGAGGTSTLTITLSNTSGTAATLIAPLIDTLPSGVVIAPTPNAGNTCGGTVTVGTSTVTLTGGAIPANGSCTVTVAVTASIGGNYINSLAAGALQTDHGNNAAPAVATLTVLPPAGVVPPTLGKAFSPATIYAGGHSTLIITLSNTSGTAANLTSPLIDTLPSGLVIAGSGPNASTTCGGVITAITGESTVTLTGGSIPANGSCTVRVDVYAPAAGSYFNSLAAGTLQTGHGNNAAPAVATLTVTPTVTIAPTLGKAFSPATINAGGHSTLIITLSNTSGTAANLTAPLTDTLPGGLVIAGSGPNASTTCGGVITAITGESTVTLTGGSIPANGSCTVRVDVYTPIAGSYLNRLPAGELQTDQGSNAAPAVATLTVTPTVTIAPTLGKAFSPATINAGGHSALIITLSNTNSTAANLTAPLIDTLPSGLVIAGTGPNASTTCGGVITAITGKSTVTLTGGSIPANGSCTVRVDVYAINTGSYYNVLPAGELQTNNGSNTAPASATLTVIAPTVTLISHTVKQCSVMGRMNCTGTVLLRSPAPSKGVVLKLTSSNTGVATVPASVTVASGHTTATYKITTKRVTKSTSLTISAGYAGTTKGATLMVTPARWH